MNREQQFTTPDAMVRRIWGRADIVLFIFGGAAGEFALNKAVDWLYYTGKLPADPIGRLFSTVAYARNIIFMDTATAYVTIDHIRAIHSQVEENRQAHIPDEAYRDVLYMLIHYSIAAYELLERALSAEEKDSVFQVFYRLGDRMQLKDLPDNYSDWLRVYEAQLSAHLHYSRFTSDLFRQYRKHLGHMRYAVLLQAQLMISPDPVVRLLPHKKSRSLQFLLRQYCLWRKLRVVQFVLPFLLPRKYYHQVTALNIPQIKTSPQPL